MSKSRLRPAASLAWIVGSLFFSVSSLASAQSSSPAFSAKGAFFALSVADLDASTRWYAEKFGMTVVMHPPKRDNASLAVLEGGGLTVELLQRDDARPLTRAAPSITENPQIYGFFKAGVIVDDFDKTVATLRARGVTIAMGPFPASETQRANVIVRDNAGNLVQIFGPSFTTRAR
jgi:catechol 2,3-dioxygenase-like lactoylglutathione lyase family enzyme